MASPDAVLRHYSYSPPGDEVDPDTLRLRSEDPTHPDSGVELGTYLYSPSTGQKSGAKVRQTVDISHREQRLLSERLAATAESLGRARLGRQEYLSTLIRLALDDSEVHSMVCRRLELNHGAA